MRELIKTLWEALSKRPLFLLALLFCLVVYCYVNYEKYHSTEPVEDHTSLTFTGIIKNKSLNEDGLVESFTVGKGDSIICYVNNISLTPTHLPIGATIQVSGVAGNFKPATNPGEFNARNYHLARRELLYVNLSDYAILSTPTFSLGEVLFRVKTQCTDCVLKNAPLEGGTINTLLFADKRHLPDARYELFRKSNLSHFLVISGLHLQILAGSFYNVLRRICKKKITPIIITLLFIYTYGSMVGFSFSVIRAAIMFLFRLISLLCKQAYDSLSALSFAAIYTLIRFPYAILDSAFLYSYGAVLCIALFYAYLFPASEARIQNDLRHSLRFRLYAFCVRSIRLPIFLYFFMLPITLSVSLESYPFSILINLILALFSAPALLFAFFTCLCCVFNLPVLAGLFDFFVALILRFMDFICTVFPKSPAFFLTGKPATLQIILYYLLLFFLFYRQKKRIRILSPILFLVSVTLLTYRPFCGFSYYMADIGQGDCNILQITNRSALLIDAGSSDKKDIAGRIGLPVLKANGITHLSGIYISHADSDHINAIYDIINSGYNVYALYLPITLKAEESEELNRIKTAAKENKIKIIYLKQGDQITYPEITLTCLWPSVNSPFDDSNENSLVLLARGKSTVLFTGDATKETETELLRFGLPHSVDILKVAHHGSSSSGSDAFLRSILPSYAFISAGRNNRYHHPHKETLNALSRYHATVFTTKERGFLHAFSLFGKEFIHCYMP